MLIFIFATVRDL